ncbi:hypothetical protein [Agromyces larvae]|uniref:Uncharacterized protein n=1 Tax=Agromyces larvae TaxID=2929802 RepID=A0ABY4BX42_9MICO|nr:hypothetical protein [Agromyces larvae]UOE43743.1 hypothetical protein MTO99_16465 [Agromyces larvae]
MTAPRTVLAASLKPILPKSWAIVESARTVDDIPTTVVQIIQRTITRLPAAPIGRHFVGMTLMISVPEQSMKHAEDTLDEQVDDFIHALDSIGIAWSNAEKVQTKGSKRIAYQITVNVISNKE